jgi:hypothetical protein
VPPVEAANRLDEMVIETLFRSALLLRYAVRQSDPLTPTLIGARIREATPEQDPILRDAACGC